MKEVDELSRETFDCLDERKEGINRELNARYKEALEALMRYNREVEWENVDALEWSTFEENVDDLVTLIEDIKEIGSKLQDILQLTRTINDQLGGV